MEFARYGTLYESFRAKSKERGREFKAGTPETFYQTIIELEMRKYGRGDNPAANVLQMLGCISERTWYKEKRPYYHLYPAVWEACLRVPLEKIDVRSLCGEFGPISVSCPLFSAPRLLHCFAFQLDGVWRRVVGSYVWTPTAKNQMHIDGTVRILDGPIDNGETVSWDTFKHGKEIWADGTSQLQQVEHGTNRHHVDVALLMMLSKCNDLLDRNVLAADRRRYRLADAALKQQLADKAERKQGQVGYTIGFEYQEELDNAKARGEQAPHMRMPHPALYHVGKGRTEQVIIFRKGSVVHRDQIEKMPTGYHDKEPEAKTT